MNQITNKLNNYHKKASSGYISKQQLKKNIASSTGLFKPNAMSIKINKISNSKDGIIYMMNQKVINGRSFDKELQDKKVLLKNLINKDKKNKDSEKSSLELESKDEISTNNLTENLYNNASLNNTEHPNIKGVNNLNININNINYYSNAHIAESGFNKHINNTNYLNSRHDENLNNHKKIELNINKIKNNKEKKNIRLNNKNKKGLYINKSNNNTEKKRLNLNLCVNNTNKRINLAKRKYSNLTENNRLNIGIEGLIPLKSKTQNYINLNIKNYYSNKKIQTNLRNINDNFNNSYENNKIKNNLLSSKKKLFIDNSKNNEEQNIQKEKNEIKNNSKKNKKMIGLNNIKFKQKNVLWLTDIFNGKKILKTNSPKNKNIDMLKNFKKNIKISNNKNMNETNHTITQEMEKIDEICYTERIERNRKSNQTKISENNKNNDNINLLIKNNILKNKIFKNNNIVNNNGIKNSKNKENINKDNLIISKKKKNSHNNLNNINPTFNPKKLETSYNEKINKNKYDNNNIPLINKVHIFEIGKTKISKNNNKDENNNLLTNIIFNNSKQKNTNNITENNINEFTPKKNILKDEFKNKLKFKQNHEKNNTIKEHIENSATPLNHKHYLIKNFKHIKENNINNDSKNKKNNSNVGIHKQGKIKDSLNKLNDEEKEFCEMETPILLNTPKLTERIFDAKLNLFEKIKNINTNYNSNNIKNKEEIPSENSDIIYEEISISSNPNKKEKKLNNSTNEKDKINVKNIIKNILVLDANCTENILDFLKIDIINLLCTINKKCFNKFKPIINKKIKSKILNYYQKTPIVFMNKIKLSLMNYSSLSKLSLLLLHKKYVDLLLENNQKYDQEIKKDLTRTFPDNLSFKYGNINYNKLYHLLTVYSLYGPKIGYVQGINFIAANIIILMEKDKEEKNLMFLDGFLTKFQFADLIGLDTSDLLKKNLNHLGEQLNTFCPEIVKFLKNSNLSHEIFSTNWMLTLFANSMESKYLFIIWDFLIIFGWKFFMGFIVSVLNLFKEEILNEEQNSLNFFMKNIFRIQKFKDKFNFIIDETFSFMEKERGNKFNEN